jgi:hypothetical protein
MLVLRVKLAVLVLLVFLGEVQEQTLVAVVEVQGIHLIPLVHTPLEMAVLVFV